MKKIKYILSIIIVMLIFSVPTSVVKIAQAEIIAPIEITSVEGDGEGDGLEDPEPTPTPDPSKTEVDFGNGIEISSSVIGDENLYSALLKVYKDSLKDTEYTYSGSVIYSNMFVNFESLNLDRDVTRKNITSLSGLEKLDLDNLKSLSANMNEIVEFDSKIFDTIDTDKFTSLSLAGNQLSSIDLSAFDRLTYVNLSSNQLRKLDLSAVEGKTVGTEITINVANNLFTSIENIKFPTKRIGHINLNVINNNVTNLTEDFFTDFFTIWAGIQGFVSDETKSVDTGKNLMIYKMGIEGLAVEIYEDGETEPIHTITDADITENYLRLNLPVGEYEYLYTIDGNNAHDRSDKDRKFLDGYDFKVIPRKATYTFIYKGKEYDNLGKVTGKVTVNLKTNEDGAKIFYQVNSGEWIEGSTIECANGGNYTIKVKTVVNGMESEIENVWVRTSLNLYISDWVMLVLVILLALVLFLVVIPIISKKYFKKD